MQQLWAPWRMTYINGDDHPVAPGCIFCLRETETEDEARLVLRRGQHACVLMNRYPYSNGHLLIAPFRHTAALGALTPEEVLEMHQLTVQAQSVLTRVMQPHAFNLGFNLGRDAGAGIIEHLHLHLVPRWQGDTNFMPVLAEVRTIPQHLAETWRLLREEFARQGEADCAR